MGRDMVVADNDLNTMPVRELIKEMREEAKSLGPEEILRTLVVMALVARIEEQADLADAAQEKIREAVLLMEPLETLGLVFEKADDGSQIATIQMDLLRQFVGSIRALSEKLRG